MISRLRSTQTSMETTFSISDDQTYLIARTNQSNTPAMGRRLFSDIAAMIATTGLTTVLLDARAQTTPFPALAAHAAGSKIAQVVPLGARIAVLVSDALELHRLVETVAVNRGASMRFFNDYDQAVAWLRGA